MVVRNDWTLLEVLMEPIWYNPNLNGVWGARIGDSETYIREQRESRDRRSHLLRVSPSRISQATAYYKLTKAAAEVGLTHIFNLLCGFHPGEKLRWVTYRELKRRADLADLALPLSLDDFGALLGSLQPQMRSVVRSAINLKNRQPHMDLPAP